MSEEISMSPCSIKKEEKIINNNNDDMDFFQALRKVSEGKKIFKREWKDKDYYGFLDEAKLKLHKPDGKSYEWILSNVDLDGTDYIII